MNTDIEALAASVSGFIRTNTSPFNLSQDIADAVSVSVLGQISTLILPNDYLWAKCRARRIASPGFSFEPVETRAVESAARLLKGAGRRALVLGGNALRRRGLQIAVRIQAATDCDLLASTFAPYLDRGIDLPDVRRIPYFPEPAFELTSRYDAVVLVGSQEPVTFFGYEGIPSYLFDQHLPRASIATDKQNVVEALECLADAVGAPARFRGRARRVARPDIKKLRGVLTAEQACRVLAATQPDDAIIVDEGITSSASYHPLTGNLPPHSILTVSGGSIGYGMPCATGTALACPDRRTINFQADGSAMYTIQALWTQAREELNVTTLICSNRSYHILRAELERAHITITGPSVASLIDLDRPNIDWVQVSQGMGVPATAVDTAEALALELAKAVHEPGPNLIEMRLTTPSKALDVDK
jgi:acetolactate synthase-1/2/3 large subunit